MVYFDPQVLKRDQYQGAHLAALMCGDHGDVLMQYTGLKDKNGKGIYEGDIVKSIAQSNDHSQRGAVTIGRVYFSTGSFKIAPDNFETGTKLFDVLLINSVEIIGNIHDNPELLNG